MTTVRIKRSSTPGAIPAAGQITSGELAMNTADRALYAKDAAGTVYKLVGPPDLFAHAVSATTLYIGRLAFEDTPTSGDPADSPHWAITRISTNAAGDVTAEASATGAWSNKTNLTYS